MANVPVCDEFHDPYDKPHLDDYEDDFWFEVPDKEICSKCPFFSLEEYPVVTNGKCNQFEYVSDYLINHQVPYNCPFELELSLK